MLHATLCFTLEYHVIIPCVYSHSHPFGNSNDDDEKKERRKQSRWFKYDEILLSLNGLDFMLLKLITKKIKQRETRVLLLYIIHVVFTRKIVMQFVFFVFVFVECELFCWNFWPVMASDLSIQYISCCCFFFKAPSPVFGIY